MKKLTIPVLIALTSMNIFTINLAHAISTQAKASSKHIRKVSSSLGINQLKHFPLASKDQVRQVVILKPRIHEKRYQVEILIGKTKMIDCNLQWFEGNLTRKNLEGFGYTYYQVDALTGPMTTRMGCDHKKDKLAFVSTHLGQDAFIPYNSRLPIVVYTPKDVNVKYRIWQTDDQALRATIR